MLVRSHNALEERVTLDSELNSMNAEFDWMKWNLLIIGAGSGLISNNIAGAVVRIECYNKDSGVLTYSKEAVTGKNGRYTVKVETDRGEDVCDAVLVRSSNPECATPNAGRDRARVILTRNNGMISNKRFANNMGFLRNTPLANCGQILQKYIDSEDDWNVSFAFAFAISFVFFCTSSKYCCNRSSLLLPNVTLSRFFPFLLLGYGNC